MYILYNVMHVMLVYIYISTCVSLYCKSTIFSAACTGSGSDTPEFIPPTPEDDSCVVIRPGGTFHTMLVAVSGNENDIITEIQTVSPAGLQKSDLFHDKDSNVFYVNITWTPNTEQENETHLFCYTATNSAGLSTSQMCINLLPGYTAPAPLPCRHYCP